MPDDPDQIIYVWFDALINYLSAAPAEWWRDGVVRRHVIGKGIVRFHALIWPAILLSAGRPLPTELFVHDYVTANGRKIGKSLGNAVDPIDLVQRFGVDAVRWWLLREVPRVGEGDFTETRLVDAANRDLANGIGNLVQRLAGLGARSEPGPLASAARLQAAIDDAIDAFDLRAATGALTAEIDVVNRAIEEAQPWTLRGEARDDVLAPLHATTRAIVDELAPFVPDLAAIARERLAGGAGPALYARRAPSTVAT